MLFKDRLEECLEGEKISDNSGYAFETHGLFYHSIREENLNCAIIGIIETGVWNEIKFVSPFD